MHLKWLCIPAALVCLLAQQVDARNIYLTPADALGTGVSTYSSDPFSFGTTVPSVTGAFTVVGSGTASKRYAISRTSTDSVTVLQGTFPLVTAGSRISVGGTPTAAALMPDGRYLILTGNLGVAIVDTTSDTVTSLMGNIDVGGEASDVSVSIDSSRAFVLSSTASRLTAVDIATRQSTGTLSLPARPTAVTTGPNGIVYVSAESTIYEIDPRTLAIRAAISASGTPGKLLFTSNGRLALAPSTAATGGLGAYLLNLSTRTVATVSGATYALVDVALAGDNLAYGVTSQGAIYVLNLTDEGAISAQQATFGGTGVPQGTSDLLTTGELPRPQYMILSAPSSLYRVNLTSLENSNPLPKPTPGNITGVMPPGQVGASGHLTYNTTQTTAAGTSSQALVVRVYDVNGLPVAGVPVVFSTNTGGVTFTSANATSNVEGYASTFATVPASMTTGSITVNASIQGGQRTAAFTITIGDPNLPGPGGGPGTTTGLQIVSGHGHVVSANFTTNPGALRVRLLNEQGLPVSGASINWSLVSGGGAFPGGTTTTTDTNGEAFTTFYASAFNPNLPYQINVIRATPPTGSPVDLSVLAVPLLPQGGPGSIDPSWPLDTVITLKAGETRQGAIQVRASVTGSSNPAPSVGLRLVPTDASSGIQCRGRIVLSDQAGLASCDVVAGATRGEFSVTAVLGEIFQRTFLIRVEQGDPTEVRILSGNNQTGLQGQTLQPFVVEVRDAAGNTLPNIGVNWDFPPFFPTPTSIQRTTDVNGRAAATFVLPSDRTGAYTVRATAGSATATFNLTINVATAGIAIVSGNEQSAIIGQAFGQPLQVRVTDAQARPVAGTTVTFNVATGTATLNPVSATTNAEGIASTTLTAGNTVGAVSVVATSGTQSTTFNLSVRQAGPVFTANDIVNGAGFLPGISPGSMAYIRAAGIAPALRGSVTPPTVVGPLPTKLADVEVLFNEIAAPIYAVSNVNGTESVIVQVPFELSAGTVNVTIRTTGGGTTTVPVTLLPVKPGVFTWTDTNGSVYAVATRPDGSYVSSANPARRGEEVRIYAAGLGQTSPATATNRVGLGGQQVAAPVIGGINDAGVRVVSAELLEGAVGVYVITLEIPADTAAGGAQPVGLGVTGSDGQVVFANSSNIPIV